MPEPVEEYVCNLDTVVHSLPARDDFNLKIGVSIEGRLAELHFSNISVDAMVVGVHKTITIVSYGAESSTNGTHTFLTFPLGGGKAVFYEVNPRDKHENTLVMTGKCEAKS